MRLFSRLFLFSVGTGVIAIAACSGPGASFSPDSATQSSHAKPMATSSATPIPFIFQTADDPSSAKNAVTGINELSKIIGVYGAGQGSSLPASYTSQPPYTKYKAMNYAGAQGTYMTSLSSNKVQAGYVIEPAGQTGTFGAARISGLWTLFADPNEGTGDNAVTEINSINDSENAVGYYVSPSGGDVPFELDVPTGVFTDIMPPGISNAVATGIDGKGSISGWESTSAGAKGFYLLNGTYYTFSYPHAAATFALGLNYSDQVVGDYVDSAGTTHGFLLTGPNRGGGSQVWQSIDEPNAAQGTWVTGINSHHDICGYYIDASGIQHGFVAVP